MTRSFLRAVSRGLVGVLLFAQMAIAAYACPELSPASSQNMQMLTTRSPDGDSSDASAASTVDRAINCNDMTGGMDPSSANLCAEHCRFGQQSDQTPTLTVPAALLSALYVTPVVPEPALRLAAAATSALAAVPPPHSILHCCFRI